VSTRAELVSRVAELAPVLRARPKDAVALLTHAGVFRLRVPKRYGGYECDAGTLVAVAAELGRAGAAEACAYWAPTWLVTRFGAQARDEVFATRDVRVCGALGPFVTASPADGGVVLDAVPDAPHANWQVVFAARDGDPVAALVPASGEQFVPAHRLIDLSTVASGLLATLWATPSAGVILGMALEALDSYFESLVTDQGLSFAGGVPTFQPAMAHVQTADALAMLTEAERHAYRLAKLVDTAADWTDEHTARARTDLAAVCRLAADAGYLLATIGGGAPIRRLVRDLGTVTHQALADFDAVLPGDQQGRAVA
jgi:alkylation response protein AidB-like acyl-CoA dehydrogenase